MVLILHLINGWTFWFGRIHVLLYVHIIYACMLRVYCSSTHYSIRGIKNEIGMKSKWSDEELKTLLIYGVTWLMHIVLNYVIVTIRCYMMPDMVIFIIPQLIINISVFNIYIAVLIDDIFQMVCDLQISWPLILHVFKTGLICRRGSRKFFQGGSILDL